ALSAYAMFSDGPKPGRITQDVDPPGFASLASLIPGTGLTGRRDEPTRVTPSPKSDSAGTKTMQKASPISDVQKVRQAEETHRERISAAKVSLQEAKRSLTEAQRWSQRLEAAQKKATAEAKEADAKGKQAEKDLRKAEESYKKASTALQD